MLDYPRVSYSIPKKHMVSWDIYIYTYHLYDHFPTTMTGCCQDAPFRDPHFGRIPKVRGRAHLSPLGHSASQAAELHSSLLEAAESASMLDRKIWENSLG
jgi:hypothetical protein